MNEPQNMEFTEQNPRPVAEKFNKHGVERTLKQRKGNVCLYGMPNGGCEIVVLRIAKPTTFPNGTTVPWREELPNDEAFGTRGWYYMAADYEKAQAKFNTLIASQE